MSRHTISQDGDNIYVNVTMQKDPNSRFVSSPASYLVTKTLPILMKCSDYYCSVIRFSIPLNFVPLFIMPIVPNQPNPDLTPFKIGIRVQSTGTLYTRDITYITGSPSYPAPVQNQQTQVITPYYYVYEYQNFINAINIALASAFVASGLTGSSPYFYLDTETEQISIVSDRATFSPIAWSGFPNPTPQATIYMNEQLQIYLSAFPVYSVGSVTTTGRDYELNLVRFGSSGTLSPFTIPPFTSTATQTKITQEYSTLSMWSSVRKLLITSNSIPIQSEYLPSNSSGISATLPIITDFSPNIENPGDNRSIAYYTPTGQYRLIDMKSSEQLNTIDIRIYWQDFNDNVYPLEVSLYQQVSIKIGFFKKTMYNTNLLITKK